VSICRDKLIYLGHEIPLKACAGSGCSVLRDRVAPTNRKELQSWLGLGNWFRKFVKDYAKLVRPLNKLNRDGVPYIWTEECEKAFQDMKEKLCSPPILAWRPISYKIYTDGSRAGARATLCQVRPDGKEVNYY
jgi:hypothetical protein